MSNSPITAAESHDEILTASEIANELRCCKAQIHKLLNGKVKGVPILPAIKIGRKRVVRRSTFEAWKQQNESGAIDTSESDAMLSPKLGNEHRGRMIRGD